MSEGQNTSAAAPLTVSVGVHCHPGRVREDNQDRISRFATPLGDFFLVADGVGGNRGGAEASAMIAEGYARNLALVSTDAEPMEALQTVSNQINGEIYQAGHSGDPERQNMGSTVAFVLLRGDGALIGHVGDSRVYHIRSRSLTQITHDHSAVQKLLDHGLVTQTQARNHPDASVLTRSFGQKPQVEVDFDRVSLQAGDGLLLCSDGLWGCVDDDDIAAVVTSPSLSVQAVTDALLDLALQAGGLDNISIEYLRFSGGSPTGANEDDGRAKITRLTATILGGLVLLTAAIFGGRELTAHFHRQGATPPPLQPSHGATVSSGNPASPTLPPPPISRPSSHPATAPSTHPGSSHPASTHPPQTQTGPPTSAAEPAHPVSRPPTPAPAGTAQPATPAPTQPVQPSTRVGVLLPKSRAIDWVVVLNRVAGAKVQPIQDPNHQCAAQAQDKPIIYYGLPNRQVASVIGVAWSPDTTLKDMNSDVQNACGAYDVIVLPAKRDLE